MRTIVNNTALMTAVLLTAGMIGCCVAPPSAHIVGGDAVLGTDNGSADFLDRMSSQTTVSENDAFRGILLLLDGKDAAKTFQQRVETLEQRDLVDPAWSFDAARPITKGKLAYMICQACKIPGGVMLQLTGPSRRYCLRELQYRNMMSGGVTWTKVTGMEFVAVLMRGDAYIQTGEVPVTATGGR